MYACANGKKRLSDFVVYMHVWKGRKSLLEPDSSARLGCALRQERACFDPKPKEELIWRVSLT